MIREIAIGTERFDMNRFGVVTRYQSGGWLYGTHVPATLEETDAVHAWARSNGATIIRHDGHDFVWDLAAARKAAREAAKTHATSEEPS